MSATANLNNLPFDALIGGPMNAAVRAQALAAQTSIDFIRSVGFKPDEDGELTDDVRTVNFRYSRNEEGEERNFELTVPLLTIVPIPYLRIDEMTIDFTARLTDVVTTESSDDIRWGVSASYGGKAFNFRASVSGEHKRQTKSQSNVEYTMDIHVLAKQDEMPKGLSRIVDLLEAASTERPAE
jgi:hypothetical protein